MLNVKNWIKIILLNFTLNNILHEELVSKKSVLLLRKQAETPPTLARARRTQKLDLVFNGHVFFTAIQIVHKEEKYQLSSNKFISLVWSFTHLSSPFFYSQVTRIAAIVLLSSLNDPPPPQAPPPALLFALLLASPLLSSLPFLMMNQVVAAG